jgi:hypothetical protein
VAATDVLGIPTWGQYLFLVAALAATSIAWLRFRYYRKAGNDAKEREFLFKIVFGLFITMLVLLRFFVIHG